MGKVYVAAGAQGQRVEYRDRKRAWWLLSVFYPLMPLVGIAAHAASGWTALLALPLVVGYGLMPLLDALVGEDPNNPPEDVVPLLEADRYYRWLTWITVPLYFGVMIACAFWAGTQALPWWALLVLAYVAGVNSGMGLTTAHELGHKHNAAEQWMARVLLAVPAYGHFTVEHGRGHHRWVSTPEDHASARMGESIYRFALRELPGGVRRAWHLEATRLVAAGRSPWSVHNTMLQSYAITAALQLGLLTTFGWVMLPFLLVHNATAWWQLTSANYVEHYGLLRASVPAPDGSRVYEAPQPRHSWNTNHLVTNLALFHLQRHSDHHANPSRRYQSLRHFPDLPQLPSGYFGMFTLAYFPRWWYRVMDARLLALPHVRGDLAKVNIDPRARAGIEARYGHPEAA
jgi:alkane 1-monooxygenase